MKIIPITVTAAALIAGFSSGAFADDIRCNVISGQPSMSIEKAIGKAESLGYAVHQAKRSKGCWKVEGYDNNGAKIEIYLDPNSGEVVRPNRAMPIAR